MPNKIDALIARFGPFGPNGVAVAVSGGPDSMALLHAAHDWGKKNKLLVTALTVDHGLRKNSMAEAKQVATWCAKHGIAHHTLVWTGQKPKTDIQNRARMARRALLLDFCAQHHIGALLMAHHADDQTETMLMRLVRGTGLTGLAAMRDETVENNVRIIRPFLSVTRDDLRAYCMRRRIPFVDDPSNSDDRFERVRVRKILASLPDLGHGAAVTATRLARADAALDAVLHDWLARHARERTVDYTAFCALPADLRLRALRHFIPDADLDATERMDNAIIAPCFAGATLGGVWVRPKVIKRQKTLVFQTAPVRRTGKKG